MKQCKEELVVKSLKCQFWYKWREGWTHQYAKPYYFFFIKLTHFGDLILWPFHSPFCTNVLYATTYNNKKFCHSGQKWVKHINTISRDGKFACGIIAKLTYKLFFFFFQDSICQSFIIQDKYIGQTQHTHTWQIKMHISLWWWWSTGFTMYKHAANYKI